MQVERPDEMALCQSILSIDGKSSEKPVIQYLSNSQTDVLMEQPDISKPKGRRDLAMLLLLYDSAARVQELCDLKVCDVRVDTPAVVHLLAREERTGRFLLPSHAPKFCGVTFRRIIWTHLDAAMIPYL